MTFAMTGVAGYVAPKHLQAIKDCGGELISATDPHDSVGILDSYNRECYFSKDFDKFYRHCIKKSPDYFVIASPNFQHYDQCLHGLRLRSTVICEKPIVLTVNDIKRLGDCEVETESRVYTILQLRLKPELVALRDNITEGHRVSVRYYTPRGHWYNSSWKNNVRMSGGLATNIGIHLFDLVLWLFGSEFNGLALTKKNKDHVKGSFATEKAEIAFDLSISPKHEVLREIEIDGELVNFTDNFTNLHTLSYQKIIAGEGFGLDVAEPSVKLCEMIRRM